MTILVVFVSCSKLAEVLHVAFISVEKHHPVCFFRWFALRFRDIMYANNAQLVFVVAPARDCKDGNFT